MVEGADSFHSAPALSFFFILSLASIKTETEIDEDFKTSLEQSPPITSKSPPKELPDFDANCGASGRLICIFKKEIPLFPGVENIPLERSAFFPEYRQVAVP